MTHNHNLIEAKIATKARKEKQGKKRNYNSWFISKWIMKHIVSFFLTPRATAYNNNNVLTFAIFEYKSLFQRNLTVHVMHAMQFWPRVKHSTNNASSVRSPYLEDFIFPCIKIKTRINKESK